MRDHLSLIISVLAHFKSLQFKKSVNINTHILFIQVPLNSLKGKCVTGINESLESTL